jgi:hypothetical protein
MRICTEIKLALVNNNAMMTWEGRKCSYKYEEAKGCH